MPFDIVLIDDHRLVREGVKAILEREAEFRIVGEAESGAEIVPICKQTAPDLVLMAIRLPGMNGIEVTGELLRQCPAVKVVILSTSDDEKSAQHAIRMGARAFVAKTASSVELLAALRTVAKGGTYISAKVSDGLVARIQRGALDQRSAMESLSRRERQVLGLVAEGKSSKDIAVVLDLELQTIRSYRKTMMKKLGVNNVAGLTQLALATGLTQSRTDRMIGDA